MKFVEEEENKRENKQTKTSNVAKIIKKLQVKN